MTDEYHFSLSVDINCVCPSDFSQGGGFLDARKYEKLNISQLNHKR